MPQPIGVADVVKVRVGTYADAQAGYNVRYFVCLAIAGTGATDADAANDLDALMSTVYPAILSSSASYYGVGVQLVTAHGQPLFIEQSAISGPTPGLMDAQMLPKQVAGVVKLITDLTGRSNRGRFYSMFPGVDGDTGAGKPTAAYLTDLDAVAIAWTGAATVGVGGNTSTLVPCVVHRPPSTIAPEPIIGYSVRNIWGTQRRRGDFGRTNPPPLS